jgi:hypothetical protein
MDGVPRFSPERKREIGHAFDLGGEVREDNRDDDFLLFEEGAPRQVSQHHRIAVELEELLLVNALRVVEAVHDPIGVFVAIRVGELEEMEAAQQTAAARAFHVEPPAKKLEPLAPVAHQRGILLQAFLSDQFLEFADPPRARDANAVEFSAKGVQVA